MRGLTGELLSTAIQRRARTEGSLEGRSLPGLFGCPSFSSAGSQCPWAPLVCSPCVGMGLCWAGSCTDGLLLCLRVAVQPEGHTHTSAEASPGHCQGRNIVLMHNFTVLCPVHRAVVSTLTWKLCSIFLQGLQS